jgi:nucleotide-binding universal stress UspA family protein
MKLLLPIDASQHTADAVDYLKRLRPSLAGTPQVLCLHVTYDLPAGNQLTIAEQARKVLREDDLDFGPERIVADLNQAGFQASLQVAEGDAVEQIIRYGDQSDLIVMGSHARGTLTQAVTGSVSTKVLADGRTPVLLVK